MDGPRWRCCFQRAQSADAGKGGQATPIAEQHAFLDLAKAGSWGEVMGMLLDNPELVDCAADGRWTALMQASSSGQTRAVEMLLAVKADPRLQGRDGTALDVAHDSVRELLLERFYDQRSEARPLAKAPMGSPASTDIGCEVPSSSSLVSLPKSVCEKAIEDSEAVTGTIPMESRGLKAASPFRDNDDSQDLGDVSERLFSEDSEAVTRTIPMESRRLMAASPFRGNDDSQDLLDVKYRPMPRITTEPDQCISQCLRDAMSISCFKGKTSRFIEELISEGWNLARDRIGRGILARHPNLTENGLFALTVFTLQLQAIVDDARDEDEFYFQFGNALRYRRTEEMGKLKPYVYHFVKGLEAMPKYQGTLWRGVHGDFAGAVCNNFSLHNLINFNAFSSATPSREVAKGFLCKDGLLFKYIGVTNTARDVREVSAYPNEDERMILAGSQFIVVNFAHLAEDGIREIHFKEAVSRQA